MKYKYMLLIQGPRSARQELSALPCVEGESHEQGATP